MTDHDNTYADLLGSDDSQSAIGHDFEDPLAGVDTTVPAGLDAAGLAAYCLSLGDDALVMSHRLSEWCSNAPDLEDDIALANIALDLLGQARLLLARAAAADPSVMPALPEGSPVPAEDALAYFREALDFRNVRLVQVANGDFGHTVARLLLVHDRRGGGVRALAADPDGARPIAAKGVGRADDRDYAAAGRDPRSGHRGVRVGCSPAWRGLAAAASGHRVRGRREASVLDQVFAASGRPPEVGAMAGRGHTEALSRLLAEVQVVARAHPRGSGERVTSTGLGQSRRRSATPRCRC